MKGTMKGVCVADAARMKSLDVYRADIRTMIGGAMLQDALEGGDWAKMITDELDEMNVRLVDTTDLSFGWRMLRIAAIALEAVATHDRRLAQ